MNSDTGSPLAIQAVINDLLQRQQDLVERSDAEGGPARYGINAQLLGDFLGRVVGRGEIAQLSPSMAATIYRHRYWHKPRIDRLPVAIQPLLFDAAISHGPRVAVFQLQQAINGVAVAGRIDEDGTIGPATLQAAQLSYERLGGAFLTRLLQQRQRTYEHLVEADPDQRVFFAGWIKRLREFATSQGVVFDTGTVI
jgi:lysozyme family protein